MLKYRMFLQHFSITHSREVVQYTSVSLSESKLFRSILCACTLWKYEFNYRCTIVERVESSMRGCGLKIYMQSDLDYRPAQQSLAGAVRRRLRDSNMSYFSAIFLRLFLKRPHTAEQWTPNPQSVAKIILPYWGIYRSWLRHRFPYSPPAYVAWRAGTTALCQSWLYPPSQGLWIWLLGYVPYEVIVLIWTDGSKIFLGRHESTEVKVLVFILYNHIFENRK